MRRTMTPSQFRSEIRRIQQKQKQEIDRVNRHNKRVVDEYNRKVRAHNQRLINEVNRLNARHASTVRHVTYFSSVQTLQRSFTRFQHASDAGTWQGDDDLFDMAEGEAANSAALLNALEDQGEATGDESRLRQTVITSHLSAFSLDLDHRWRGALHALSPANPDAARQFCTSARELLVGFLDHAAPEAVVKANVPNLQLKDGQVPRREKIRWGLKRSGQHSDELEAFVEDDINDIMNLFKELNPATHGPAGHYNLNQLGEMKKRMEGAILFLHRIFVGTSVPTPT